MYLYRLNNTTNTSKTKKVPIVAHTIISVVALNGSFLVVGCVLAFVLCNIIWVLGDALVVFCASLESHLIDVTFVDGEEIIEYIVDLLYADIVVVDNFDVFNTVADVVIDPSIPDVDAVGITEDDNEFVVCLVVVDPSTPEVDAVDITEDDNEFVVCLVVVDSERDVEIAVDCTVVS